MKRSGNFYYHLRTLSGMLIHRGMSQSSAPLKSKCRKINGIEAVNSPNGVIDFKITQEGLRIMRRGSFVIIGDPHCVWTPSRIARFARRVQMMNIGERIEVAGKNASRRQGNIKF